MHKSLLKRLKKKDSKKDFSLVSLIGNNINHTPGLGLAIFKALENINVRMICQGASVHNFCFLVNQQDGDKAIKGLHHTFIEEGVLQ